MNVVIGSSIKIETTIDVETSAFVSHFFKPAKFSEFVFYDQENKQAVLGIDFDTQIKMGDHAMILQGDDISIETHVVKTENQKTKLVILVDVFNEKVSINDVINTVVSNSEYFNNENYLVT